MNVVYSPVMNNCVAFKTIQLASELFCYVVECVFSVFSSSVFIPTHTKKNGCEKKGGRELTKRAGHIDKLGS